MPLPQATTQIPQPTQGETADAAMRAANIADASAQSVIGFERLRRLAQGKATLLRRATAVGKGYAKKAGMVGLAIAAGNAAWLATDVDKRARAAADFEGNAEKPTLERMVEGGLNATDTLYATGKAVYDTGKTYESIERSQMDEINNSLLRKIAKHEASSAQDRLGTNPKVEQDRPRGGIQQSPLAESWMRAKAQQQRQQQEDLAATTSARESLSAVMSFSRLGGRPTNTLTR